MQVGDMVTYLGKLKGRYAENRKNLHVKGEEEEEETLYFTTKLYLCI